MNYLKINRCDIANGSGIRVVLWVSGCNHYCPGCQNPETWDPSLGQQFTTDTVDELIECLSKPYISGITFSGGDPMFPDNRADILNLAKVLKDKFPNKNIWCYTGYSWEEICTLPGIEYIDVIVDGEYQQELRNISLPWCGSENQRIIDVKSSLIFVGKNNDKTVVLY